MDYVVTYILCVFVSIIIYDEMMTTIHKKNVHVLILYTQASGSISTSDVIKSNKLIGHKCL